MMDNLDLPDFQEAMEKRVDLVCLEMLVRLEKVSKVKKVCQG